MTMESKRERTRCYLTFFFVRAPMPLKSESMRIEVLVIVLCNWLKCPLYPSGFILVSLMLFLIFRYRVLSIRTLWC